MKQFYSLRTVKTGTKLQKRQLLLFVSFSVSGPSDNSVHGETGISHESSFMPIGIPGFSADGRLYDEQALLNIKETTLPFYQFMRSDPEPAISGSIYNNGMDSGEFAGILTHLNETKQNRRI